MQKKNFIILFIELLLLVLNTNISKANGNMQEQNKEEGKLLPYLQQQEKIKYNEYLKKVPIDKVFIVFAAENNQYPSSMMGHVFLKLNGKDKQGQIKEHAFSYFAVYDSSESLDFYLKIITAQAKGIYSLYPYKEKIEKYLYDENRSIWEFEIELTPTEIDILKENIWKLKDYESSYSLISNNCSTAMENLLRSANADFHDDTYKPFVTPIEYIKYLAAKDKIKNITLEPSNYASKRIKRTGIKNILNAYNSSRLDISYDNKYNFGFITLSPVYQDIRDINKAYSDEMESKIGEMTLKYHDKSLKVENINILKMKSLPDFFIDKTLSKYFKLSVERDDNTSKHLQFVSEIGLGITKYNRYGTFYILPQIGYGFENIYVSPEIGYIKQIKDKAKVIATHKFYFSNKEKNNEKESKIYLGYALDENKDIYINYAHSKKKSENDITIGITYKF